VGAQSSTVIRGMNTDEIRGMSPLQVILREGTAGALLGSMLGVVATGWAVLQRSVAIAVGISLLVISLSVSGSTLPFLFRLMRLDQL